MNAADGANSAAGVRGALGSSSVPSPADAVHAARCGGQLRRHEVAQAGQLAPDAAVAPCLLDDHSPLALGCDARAVFQAADVVTSFRKAAAGYGVPGCLLSDNAAIFTGSSRGGGRVALELELAALGVAFRHSRPYHPQTCGKVERFHQTLKKWLARQPAVTTVGQLQAQLDQFRGYYNTARPHRALRRATPQAAFHARPKATPTGQPITTGHYRIRQDRIDDTGVITLRHNSRLHHLGIGRAHAGTHVLVLVHDLNIRVLTHEGELLRELTLDPTRDYQRQAKT